MSEFTGQQPPLSPDLARNNPEVFKTSLIKELGQKHPLARRAWDKIVQEGRTSLADVKIIPSTFVSLSSGKEIRLGTAPLSQGLKDQILFEDQTFRYSDEVLYRFSHEATHKYAVSTSEDTADGKSLYDQLINIRRQYGNGLSALGSLEFYQSRGVEVQAREDLVELINMRLWNASYFERFINFMGNPDRRRELKSMGLALLGNSAQDHITKNVERIVRART
jgi:hypothetical protein